MRKLNYLFIATLAMLIFASCARRDDIDPEYFFQDRSLLYGESLTITVPTLAPFFIPQLLGAIGALEEELEDYNVTIRLNVIEDTSPELSIFEQRVSTEIMAGTLDGLVMLVNGHCNGFSSLDWRNPEVSRFFADMWPILRADPEFNNDNFVYNIFEAFTLGDGSLRVIPEAINFRTLRANRTIPGLEDAFLAFDSVTIYDLHELHDRYVVDGTHYIFLGYHPMHIASVLVNEFIDMDNMTANFYSERFIELMEQALELTNLSPNVDMLYMWLPSHGIVEPEALNAASYAFMHGITLLQVYELVPLAEHTSLFSQPLPFTNNEGELLINPFMPFVMSASSSNAERVLAWKFIKHLSSVERFNPASNIELIHISRPRTHRNIYHNVNLWYFGGTFANHFARQTGFSLDMPEDEARNIIMEFYRKVSNMPMVLHFPYRRTIWNAIWTTTESIHNGVVPPSQAAAELQNRVMLIMMEGN